MTTANPVPGPLGALRSLGVSDVVYFHVEAADAIAGAAVRRLPISLKILMENLLRHEDGVTVTRDDIAALARWPVVGGSDRELAFRPARILMPDSSGVPLLADLSAMRDAVAAAGGKAEWVDPVVPVDIVVDHSVVAEHAGTPDAAVRNGALEFRQNGERYEFLRWAEGAYRNLRIVPPGMGIVHQVNIEYLASPVRTLDLDGRHLAIPDTVVGMDSHTTMVNALGILGWGVGGIEAASAMLGEPISLLLPEVVGCRLTGRLREGVTSTDLVLTVVERLREHGVVGKLVEFFGHGLSALSLPDRATLANMAPEYGATMGFFPIDDETLRYLAETGRDPDTVALTERYARAQGFFRADDADTVYSSTMTIELGEVETSLAGPRRPQDRLPLSAVPGAFAAALPHQISGIGAASDLHDPRRPLRDGDVVIAAITSCTNTSNPSAMLRAGLLARKAVDRGLTTKPWVKTTLSPGSRVVTDYLAKAGLQDALDALGFYLTGYGCMTCSGSSGALAPDVADAIEANNLSVATVLSGNRNFEGRIHPAAHANFLASPPLVVAYAIMGSVSAGLRAEPLGLGSDGRPVYLADIWPSDDEVRAAAERCLTPDLFTARYASVFRGGEEWRSIVADDRLTFDWDPKSTYLLRPPYLDGLGKRTGAAGVEGGRILGIFGDGVTTDHISPGGAIPEDGPAGRFLIENGVRPDAFNSYLGRRGNHQVMLRGTFGNTRLCNRMIPERRGGWTRHMPDGDACTIFDAAMRYAREGVPLVIIAGQDYGAGSSRDWAAKGTSLLGVRAVIAESFERIHRSNLVGMGVLPLEFSDGATAETLGLDGSESIDIPAAGSGSPRTTTSAWISRSDGSRTCIQLRVRIDTPTEATWFAKGGILPFVADKLLRNDRSKAA